MRNLLSAGFYRLWRDKWLWIGMGCAGVLSAVLSLQCTARASFDHSLDFGQAFNQFAPFTGIAIALYTALITGTEHGDGALRNKLMVGHTRAQIYLAQFTVVLTAAGCFTAAWMLGGLAGVPALGWWRGGIGTAAAQIGVALGASAALSALTLLLTMITPHRAVSVALAVLLAAGLIFLGAALYDQLSAPETYYGTIVSVDEDSGEPIMRQVEAEPNPRYISGTERTVKQFILDCLPTGQQILLATQEMARPLLSAAASVFLIFAGVLAGVFAFGKMDLT